MSPSFWLSLPAPSLSFWFAGDSACHVLPPELRPLGFKACFPEQGVQLSGFLQKERQMRASTISTPGTCSSTLKGGSRCESVGERRGQFESRRRGAAGCRRPHLEKSSTPVWGRLARFLRLSGLCGGWEKRKTHLPPLS